MAYCASGFPLWRRCVMRLDQLTRRQLLALLSGSLIATTLRPSAARARYGEQVRRLGVLMAGARGADGNRRVAVLLGKLRTLGWTEGRNLALDLRWGGGAFDGIRAAAAKVVADKPDVIFCNGTRSVLALLQNTHTVPIVFAGLADPVENGLVRSMARPGGNVTGFVHFQTSLVGKMLEILNEMSPTLVRVVLLQNPDDPATNARRHLFGAAARALGIRPVSIPLRKVADMERALAALDGQGGNGLIVMPSATAIVHRKAIISAAARHHMPAIYPFRIFANDGGLMYYGADVIDLTRRAASYVDRILRGESPAELPVQTPVRYRLIINLKAAKALGITVPRTLLVSADKVIE
jgi:ABC-type uncharacterized transport system substrate-binding protein